jgi:hypothetical protein
MLIAYQEWSCEKQTYKLYFGEVFMFSKLLKVLLVTFPLLTFGAKSFAEIVNFEAYPGNCRELGSSITTQGFVFLDNADRFFGCNAGVIHNGSSVALISAGATSKFAMREQSNSLFTLSSLEAGSRTSTAQALGFTVFGTKFDTSVVSQSFTFSGFSFDLFTLSPSFTDLTSARFVVKSGGGNQFLVDNIAINESLNNESLGATNVSSPLFVFGGLVLLGMGFMRRRS